MSEVPQYYSGNKRKKIRVHIMLDNKEVGKAKCKIYDKEFTWKKRIYPVEQTRIITDLKGNAHLYVHANKMQCLSLQSEPIKENKFVDARNARDLLKRKTIQAVWGVDSMPMIMLMILMLGMVIMAGAIMFIMFDPSVIPQVKAMKEELARYKSLPPALPPATIGDTN